MKTTITLLAMFFGSLATILAQDIITLKNGDEIKALVQEAGVTEVKYKKYDNANGTAYTLSKSEIFMIKYGNGERVVFTDAVATSPPAALQKEKLRVALIGITPTSNYGWSKANELTSILTTELVKTNRFRVVERARIQEILDEQGFQDTQAASAQAVKIGRLLGIHKIITGEYGGWDGHTTIRFIDVETGDIEAAIAIDNLIRKKNGKVVRSLTAEEIVKKLLEELFKAIR
jgi:curli biogenesis system outer membrane secretion channel CsgG